MQKTILELIRLFFAVAGRVAPGLAGRIGFALFCAPRFRKPPPRRMAKVMARAERHTLEHRGDRIAWYRFRAQSPEAGGGLRVLIVHGWESRAARLAQWVEPLLERGFEVVAFDGPAHGESTGRRTTMPAFIAAMRAVVDEAGPVDAVIGHSFGAAAAMLAASPVVREIGLEPLDPERLVLIAGPDRVDDVVDRFAAFVGLPARAAARVKQRIEEIGGLPIETYSASRLLAESGLPALIVHDPDDEEIPFSDAERLAAAPQAELLMTRGLGHHRVARDAAVIEKGVEFLAGIEKAAA